MTENLNLFVGMNFALLVSMYIQFCNAIVDGPEVKSMPNLQRNLHLIKEDCGQVCDTSNNFVVEHQLPFDRIVKDIDCNSLFESPLLEDDKHVYEQQLQNDGSRRAPKEENVPKDILRMYSFNGRIKISHAYLNDFKWTAKEDLIWSKKAIEDYREQHRSGKMWGFYGFESVHNITENIKEHMLEQVTFPYFSLLGISWN